MASLPAFRENGSARTPTRSGSNPAGIEPEPLEDRGQSANRLSTCVSELLTGLQRPTGGIELIRERPVQWSLVSSYFSRTSTCRRAALP